MKYEVINYRHSQNVSGPIYYVLL